MCATLTYFHNLCQVFIETGVHLTSFNLPCQHVLVHYTDAIEKFGSPNALCSSITESKHIEAVKCTWQQSSHN
ncbi:hypothetical protein L226DRAFT_474341 [Lentinus tigrinus ALCF2SS1-7]|uniref:uncharacterized protein n=1 Tax=Lentinus tigrinus ALCF2SS1-7 TaxID=1328758 RepID=UPI0011663AEE|nr:hypothetical protein L226DRAFT_474341 [Lentinus tigrinus ALCF2SS1-7]